MRFFVDGSITTPITEYLTNPKYQQVEYLESTGTQYINTGINASGNISFVLSSTPDGFDYSSAKTRFGSKVAEGDSQLAILATGGNFFRIDYGTGTQSQTNWNQSVIKKVSTFNLDANTHTVTMEYVDNTSESHTWDSSVVSFSSTYPLLIFAYNNGSTKYYASSMKVTCCKIWDGDAFVRNFIPAIRKEDGKPGMYDKVSGQFFTNAGTGEFLYGNPVYSNVPRGYKECEYLESTGTQYIDTGLTGNNNIKLQTKIYPTVINKFIFGSRVSAATDAFGLFMHSNDGGSWYPFFGNGKSMIPGFAINNDYTIEFSKDGLIVDGTLLQGPYDNTFTNALTMKLFTIDTAGTVDNRMFIGKIYYSKIWDSNILVRDFIPVLREADNEPGMYDRVSNTFFTNKGTGTFTYKLKERQTEKVTRILYSGSKMRLVRNTAA